MPELRRRSPAGTGNLVAFWVLGLCNNFAYVIMLSAAKDILEMDKKTNLTSEAACIPDMSHATCSPISTGAVLLADIIPSLITKFCAPLFLYKVAYNVRTTVTVLLMASSFVVVALSKSVFFGLFGVVLASFGAGLGEVTFLSLSSYFHGDVISTWSSGTGGAGVVGAMAYAILTEKTLLALSPQTALFSMLVVPFTFFMTYWKVLRSPPRVHKAIMWMPSTYIVEETSRSRNVSDSSTEQDRPLIQSSDDEHEDIDDGEIRLINSHSRWEDIKPLLRYMIPLCVVYFGEYFINQGLVELLIFDCAHGFQLYVPSQYRWYQVLYQIGVFMSRSSVSIIQIGKSILPLLAVLQLVNASGLFIQTMGRFVPHISIIFIWILFEGFLGGAAYVNTFRLVHRDIPRDKLEFSMSFVSCSDSVGILLAGFVAIPVHNFICSRFFSFF